MKRKLNKEDSPEAEKIVLSPEDSALDAVLLCTLGKRLPYIECAIAALPDDNPNKQELQKYRRWFGDSVASGNQFQMTMSAHLLVVSTKAAVLTIPSAIHGEKFKDGRKPGTPGRVRKAIRALLKKNTSLKNPEIWSILKNKPPSGWNFFDNRHGEYIEHQDGETKRAQFNNICSEERREIRG